MPTADLAYAWDCDTKQIDARWPQNADERLRDVSNAELAEEIARARTALSNFWNSDPELSGEYSTTTLDRAIAFLRTHLEFLRQFEVSMPIPTIGPGPEGSIDLHWKRGSWELLVNIREEPEKMASFYGDNYGVQKIRGSVDPKTCNLGLAAWLMN